MAPIPSLSSWSPFRKLDGRRIRALELVRAEQRKLGPGDNRYVRDYFRFLDSLANADGDEEREADVRRLHPLIWEGHSVFCADIETRQQLEARLLTREAFNRTAQRFDLQEASVRAYEKLFFHCFDRFESSDWMWLAVIRGDVRDAVGEEAQRVARRGFLMRWFGYYGGSIALDAFLGHWPETTGQKAPLDVSK